MTKHPMLALLVVGALALVAPTATAQTGSPAGPSGPPAMHGPAQPPNPVAFDADEFDGADLLAMLDDPGPGDPDLAMMDDGPPPEDAAADAAADGGGMRARHGGAGPMGGPGARFGRGARGMGPGGGGPWAMRGRGPRGAMLRQLHLTDAQRQRLADIHERQQRHDIPAHADLALARLDMRKLMRADKPDAGAINAQIDRVARLRAEQAKTRVASLLEARAVLTPEQLGEMRRLREAGPGAGRDGRGDGARHGADGGSDEGDRK